jgi:hypothetical protein
MKMNRRFLTALVAGICLLLGRIDPALAIGVGDPAPEFELNRAKAASSNSAICAEKMS